ncbi:MAG: hypothetical protein JWR84_1867 [Caulobacter sp.]|nr:hypothetical protein [Caulobacter sp.]
MRSLFVSLGVVLILAGCGPKPPKPWDGGPGVQAETQIFVLVDLSATWLNERSRPRNEAVLGELGHGLALAAEELPQPLLIQHRIIGANSLERPPLCDLIYQRTLAPKANQPSYQITSAKKLRNYLGIDCPRFIIGRPAEPLTEISAAVISVANQRARSRDRRYIVVVSDFLEETSQPVSLPSNLSGFRVLMIYRPVTEDMPHPASMTARVEDWRREFARRGAEVIAIPDTGLKRAAVASYITPK